MSKSEAFEQTAKVLAELEVEQKNIGTQIAKLTREMDVIELQRPGNEYERLEARRQVLPALVRSARVAMLRAKIDLCEAIATQEREAMAEAVTARDEAEQRYEAAQKAMLAARRKAGAHRERMDSARKKAYKAKDELTTVLADGETPRGAVVHSTWQMTR